MSMKKSNVTIKQIAQEAGVSYAAVSMALRDHPEISVKRRQQIKKIADKLKYKPNLLVRGLKGKSTHTLGIITTTLDVETTVVKVQSFERAAREKEYLAMMAFNPGTADLEDELIIWLMQRGIDGLAIYPIEHGEHKELHRLVNDKFPVVTFNGKGRLGFDTNDVSVDYYEGGRLQAQHLLEIDRKNVCYIHPKLLFYTIHQRMLGASDFGRQTGMKIDFIGIEAGDTNDRSRSRLVYHQCREVFKNSIRKYDAVICSNDVFALASIHALIDIGIKVPDDIAVVGFDDIRASELSNLSLTTISQCTGQVGASAFDILEKLFHKNKTGKQDECIRVMIKPKLVVRASTIGRHWIDDKNECLDML